jgi:hypothetical protein
MKVRELSRVASQPLAKIEQKLAKYLQESHKKDLPRELSGIISHLEV